MARRRRRRRNPINKADYLPIILGALGGGACVYIYMNSIATAAAAATPAPAPPATATATLTVPSNVNPGFNNQVPASQLQPQTS